MKEFKYDVVTLIQSVKDRPCLWDKTLENYKDRVERRTAWEEIFNILDDRYEELTPEEKRITGEHVLNKWTNVRDTFVKTLKTKMGRPKRKYILYDHLKFLTKVTPEEECNFECTDDVPVSFMKQEDESDRDSCRKNDYDSTSKSNDLEITYYTHKRKSKRRDITENEPTTSSNDISSHRRKSKRNRVDSPNKSLDAVNDIDFVEVDASSDPRVMNEDEAFFASLLPTIVKYNEDERLEFRIEVLAVMKKIKDNRKWSGDDQ